MRRLDVDLNKIQACRQSILGSIKPLLMPHMIYVFRISQILLFYEAYGLKVLDAQKQIVYQRKVSGDVYHC
jgi:hypothetical protein